MTNIVLFGYYFKYKQNRQVIKDLVSVDNFSQALAQLQQIVTEHNNYVSANNIENTGNNFTSVDNLSLNHAKDHLASFVENGQSHQKGATIDALDEQ